MERMQQAGVPWQRPPDYYAEMVKSDAHMSRIKDQLMYEQRQIEEAEERCAEVHYDASSPKGHVSCAGTNLVYAMHTGASRGRRKR